MTLYFCLLLLVSCASSMRGTGAKLVRGEERSDLKVSARQNKVLSQEHYHLFDLYFLNSSFDWIRIKKLTIKDVNGHQDFHIIQGEDLESWKKSMILNYDLDVEEAQKTKSPGPNPEIPKMLKKYDPQLYIDRPLSLPARLQTERWVLFQLKEKESIKKFMMEIEFLDATAQVYEVQVKESK